MALEVSGSGDKGICSLIKQLTEASRLEHRVCAWPLNDLVAMNTCEGVCAWGGGAGPGH